VLLRMICALRDSSSFVSMLFTVAWVPTGMNIGVSISPWSVWMIPVRARQFEELWVISKNWDILFLYNIADYHG